MEHEQHWEQHAHDPPPNPEEVWYIKEGEMRPNEIRNLGKFLYLKAFDPLLRQDIVAALHQNQEHEMPREDSEVVDVESVPCELYIEEFTERLGFSTSIVKRWASAASIELASICLPRVLAGRDRDIRQINVRNRDKEVHEELLRRYEAIIDPVIRVAQFGLNATIQDHFHLIDEVNFQIVDNYFKRPEPPAQV